MTLHRALTSLSLNSLISACNMVIWITALALKPIHTNAAWGVGGWTVHVVNIMWLVNLFRCEDNYEFSKL
jgi:hypothetical protein